MKKLNQKYINIIAVASIVILLFFGISQLLKPALIFQYNCAGTYSDGTHKCNIGGYSGYATTVSSSAATFCFDKGYGCVTFNSAGYGENDKLTVQLNQEYGHYFCPQSMCGGFSDWISSGTVTIKVSPTPTPIPPPIQTTIPSQHQCSDGSWVTNPSLCLVVTPTTPILAPVVTETSTIVLATPLPTQTASVQYQCSNGDWVYNSSDCPQSTPGFEAVFAITGLLITAWIILRRR